MLPAEPATKEALNFLYLSYVRIFIGLAFVFLAGMKEISAGALLSSQENRTLTFLVCQIIFVWLLTLVWDTANFILIDLVTFWQQKIFFFIWHYL